MNLRAVVVTTAAPEDRGAGEVLPSKPSATASGQVLSFPIGVKRLATPPVPNSGWSPAACRVEDETASARSVRPNARVLKPLWTVPLQAVAELRQRMPPGPDTQGQTCSEESANGASFVTQGQLWIDRLTDIAMLDPSSGRPLRKLPTPRSNKVCSVPVPEAGGFVNRQGDTLSWRPFEPVSGSVARQVVDSRPGWRVSEVMAMPRGFAAVWFAKPGAVVPAPVDGQARDMAITTYHATTRKRIDETFADAGSFAMGGDGGPSHEQLFLPACRDLVGARTSGFDWRVSHFGSFRAQACKPDGTQTVFWSHLDIAPKPALPDDVARGFSLRRVWPTDGPIALAQNGGRVHVFDLTERQEVGRIQLPPEAQIQVAHVMRSAGLVVIESIDADTPDAMPQLRLRAYSYKR